MVILLILGYFLLSTNVHCVEFPVNDMTPNSWYSRDLQHQEATAVQTRLLNENILYDYSDYDIPTTEDEFESIVTLRLYGNTILGYYYVTLFFGNPLQRQNLIVDTGSTITTVPCKECGSECGTRHMNNPFDRSLSQSHQHFMCNERFGNYMCNDCEKNCAFQIGYTEGSSYHGHFTKDYVVFGNEIEDHYVKKGFRNLSEIESQPLYFRHESSNKRNIEEDYEAELALQKVIDKRRVYMPFGCTTKETKLFYYQEADGILGLGVYTNSVKIPPNIVDVFGMSKDGAFNAFSICLASEGGLLTVGGYNKSYHDPNDTIKYVPFYADSGQYRVHLNRIEFGGNKLNLSEETLNHGQGAFFDSGTTLAYAPSSTVKAIKEALEQHCSLDKRNCGGNKRRGMCWLFNPNKHPTVEAFYQTFGTFSLYFGQGGRQRYEWKPEDYLYQEISGSRWFCLGLEVFEDRTILGGTFMKNHDIIFDKREKRIGFIRANCTISIPEWIGTSKFDESKVTSENIFGLFIILVVGLLIFVLIRTNRRWDDIKDKYFLPLIETVTKKNFGSTSSLKSRTKLVFPE